MDELCAGEARATSGTGPATGPRGRLTLPPRPESVALARRWFAKFLAPYGLEDIQDDAVLLLSELVTNAVLHARPPGAPAERGGLWRIRVEWWREGSSLRVAVHSPGHPSAVRPRTVEDVGPRETGGRGLALVHALADDWSVAHSPYGGTAVTFTLSRPPAP